MPLRDWNAEPGIRAVRTWRSDGGTNVMPLEAAVENLMWNNPDYKEEGAEAVREALMAGCELDTPLATFRIWTGNGVENELLLFGVCDD